MLRDSLSPSREMIMTTHRLALVAALLVASAPSVKAIPMGATQRQEQSSSRGDTGSCDNCNAGLGSGWRVMCCSNYAQCAMQDGTCSANAYARDSPVGCVAERNPCVATEQTCCAGLACRMETCVPAADSTVVAPPTPGPGYPGYPSIGLGLRCSCEH